MVTGNIDITPKMEGWYVVRYMILKVKVLHTLNLDLIEI